VHLGCNVFAVRSVRLRTLNRQRANIVLTSLICDNDAGKIPIAPSLAEVSTQEWLFHQGSKVNYYHREKRGYSVERQVAYAYIGVPLGKVVSALAFSCRPSIRNNVAHITLSTYSLTTLIKAFEGENYIFYPRIDAAYNNGTPIFYICLRRGSTSQDAVKAWLHMLAVAKQLSEYQTKERIRLITPDIIFDQIKSWGGLLERKQCTAQDYWQKVVTAIEEAGWDISEGALETSSGMRSNWNL
jgi:hypothetical protein